MTANNNKLRQSFDQIAQGWYGFRHHTIFRHELDRMAKRWQMGRLLNLGCGHGPDNIPFIKDFDLYGVDFSLQMLKLARRYALKYNFTPRLVQSDIRSLPFFENVFDYAISIATFHHLRPRDQVPALGELKRVLKPGGEVFITAWNRLQKRFHSCGNAVNVPWQSRGRVYKRYYYLFTYEEFEARVKQAGLEVLQIFPESTYRGLDKSTSRNICLLAKKPR